MELFVTDVCNTCTANCDKCDKLLHHITTCDLRNEILDFYIYVMYTYLPISMVANGKHIQVSLTY